MKVRFEEVQTGECIVAEAPAVPRVGERVALEAPLASSSPDRATIYRVHDVAWTVVDEALDGQRAEPVVFIVEAAS